MSDCNFESNCAEVNLRKKKWIINGSCNPNKGFRKKLLDYFNRIEEYTKTYQNFLLPKWAY